ncbi:hypothetical protein [Leptospira idonii]|uniref:Uncharacterized protein n=1 Tax=Leptospira idonii TaxID=1193500 RepID=A0A4R9M138_9LEPT|nr:hypothetical protein [Leptospira idonii]TGN20410.1 hypothetical protein EHS15_04145 [Leptospira idonii]
MEASEVLNLIFDSIGLVIFIILYLEGLIPRYQYFFLGFFSIWMSNVFTVAEGFYFPVAFNFLEHFFYSLSGLFFLLGIWKHFKEERLDSL